MAPKIINIERDDTLADLERLFQNSEADEFFFVVPKSHKIFLDPELLQNLAQKTAKSRIRVNIITSDERIALIAQSVGFAVLQEKKRDGQIKAKEIKKPLIREVIQEKEPTSIEIEGARIKKVPIDIQVSEDRGSAKKFSALTNEETSRDEELTKLYHEPPPGQSRTQVIKEIVAPLKKRAIYVNSRFFSSKRLIYLVVSVFILTTIFAILNTGHRAKIFITPQTEKINLNLALIVSQTPQNGQIQGRTLKLEKSLSETGQSSGEKFIEQKATGLITIYNEFSSSPQPLVATTRFQTKEGLIFRIPDTITIPGAKLKNGKLTPGNIESEVTADKPGDSYNIAPGRFAIPGFLGTSKYERFYAISTSPMKNGFKGKTKFATKEDIEKITQGLAQKIKNDISAELNSKKTGDEIILEQDFNPNIAPTRNSAVENELGEKFTIELRGQISSMLLTKKALEAAINDHLNQGGENRKPLIQTLKYSFENGRFITADSFSFNLSASLDAVPNIGTSDILRAIPGFDETRINTYFKDRRDIDKVKILISPPWRKTLPKNKTRIEIRVLDPI